jgi:outer membrane lipoprotein-sorting protein
MRRVATFVCLSALIGAVLTAQTPAKKTFEIVKDPKATIIAQTAVTAMGGNSGILSYQDSMATGTLTLDQGGHPTTFPIMLKSKGTHETRIEVQTPNGIRVRILKEGRAALQKPDGTVQTLATNNSVGERVGHIPLLSLLAEYQSSDTSVTYEGTAQVNGHLANVVAVCFVPRKGLTEGRIFASITKTLFYVDQATGMVDKVQYENYEEGNLQQYHQTMEEYFTQYKNVNGIAVPFHQVTYAGGKLEADLVLTSVTFNVGLSDSDFTLPQRGLP